MRDLGPAAFALLTSEDAHELSLLVAGGIGGLAHCVPISVICGAAATGGVVGTHPPLRRNAVFEHSNNEHVNFLVRMWKFSMSKM